MITMKQTKHKKAKFVFAAFTAVLAVLFLFAACPDPGSEPEPDPTETTETPDDDAAPPANVTLTEAASAAGDTFVSRGKATKSGAKTYYLDAENGNDNWSGTSPTEPWKSFKNVNRKKSTTGTGTTAVFKAGDHILLEANSVWNGTPVTKTNYKTLAESNRSGMLYPKGSGTEADPIVIDLYRIDWTNRATKPKLKDASGETVTVTYSAGQRPIINGNGTPSTDVNDPYGESGTIHIAGQDYWHIRNIEVTNTFGTPATGSNAKQEKGNGIGDLVTNPSLREEHWYSRYPRKRLLGIKVTGVTDHGHNKGILIENCYAHDVQSEHNNNSGPGGVTNTYFGTTSAPGKNGGGIIFAITDSTVRNNIVRRTGLEGLRTNHGDSGYHNIIENNFVDTVAGDGIVTSRNKIRAGENVTDPNNWNYVRSNIVKDACAAPNLGSGNYAACWDYYSEYTVFEYNEAYGTLYGYQDGEAWDQDISSNQNVFQYNYSHQNAGGCMLFMTTNNCVFRYNISADDGRSSRFLYDLRHGAGSTSPTGTDPLADNYANPVSQQSSSYTAWTGGQTIFHYTNTATSGGASIPLIHNNVFYQGPATPNNSKVGLFGNNSGSGTRYVRFYNNIFLKEGDGTVYLAYGHSGGGAAGNIHNDQGLKNNIWWAFRDRAAQDTGDQTAFNNGSGTAIGTLFTQNGNMWANPKLKIQETGMDTVLRSQRDTMFPAADYNDPAKLTAWTGKTRLRSRASLFMPTVANVVAGKGMNIPNTTDATIDNAYTDGGVTYDGGASGRKDFFGNAIATPPAVGASEAVWSSTYDPTN